MKKRSVDDLLRIACGHAIASLETEGAGYQHDFQISGSVESKEKAEELFDLMEQIRRLYERRWGSGLLRK